MVKRIINEDGYTKVSFPKYQEHNDAIKKLFKTDDPGSLGKYLIFSYRKDSLIELGEIICKHFDLSEYWVSNEAKGEGIFSFVLKIYDTSDKYSRVIPALINHFNFLPIVEYRYWKPEWKSKEGIYSEEYLSTKSSSIYEDLP